MTPPSLNYYWCEYYNTISALSFAELHTSVRAFKKKEKIQSLLLQCPPEIVEVVLLPRCVRWVRWQVVHPLPDLWHHPLPSSWSRTLSPLSLPHSSSQEFACSKCPRGWSLIIRRAACSFVSLSDKKCLTNYTKVAIHILSWEHLCYISAL